MLACMNRTYIIMIMQIARNEHVEQDMIHHVCIQRRFSILSHLTIMNVCEWLRGLFSSGLLSSS